SDFAEADGVQLEVYEGADVGLDRKVADVLADNSSTLPESEIAVRLVRAQEDETAIWRRILALAPWSTQSPKWPIPAVNNGKLHQTGEGHEDFEAAFDDLAALILKRITRYCKQQEKTRWNRSLQLGTTVQPGQLLHLDVEGGGANSSRSSNKYPSRTRTSGTDRATTHTRLPFPRSTDLPENDRGVYLFAQRLRAAACQGIPLDIAGHNFDEEDKRTPGGSASESTISSTCTTGT
ncbi:unnamed protein product, partial [Amoebophrya sp. A25]